MNGPYSVRVPGPVARPRAGRVGGLAAKALLDPKPITLTATIMWAHWRRPSTIPITVMAGATPPKNIRQAAPVLPRQRQRPSSRQLPRRRSAPGPRPRAPPIMPRLCRQRLHPPRDLAPVVRVVAAVAPSLLAGAAHRPRHSSRWPRRPAGWHGHCRLHWH
jgi:hypothetical protein